MTKHKEYLDTNYELRSIKQTSGDNHVPSGWIEVPECAEKLLFSKTNNNRKHFVNGLNKLMSVDDIENRNGYWYGNAKEYDLSVSPDIIWKRSETENTEQPTGIEATQSNTTTKEKLKFIEKWLNGEKIQYILGIETDKSQWHNFTEGAMQYIKRSDIKFREAPKYVTINGIEFKSVKSLLKHVKNNFDLEDEENK